MKQQNGKTMGAVQRLMASRPASARTPNNAIIAVWDSVGTSSGGPLTVTLTGPSVITCVGFAIVTLTGYVPGEMNLVVTDWPVAVVPATFH